MLRAGEEYMEACRRNVSGQALFTIAEDDRLAMISLTACRMAWDAVQQHLFRTAGSREARDGARMQRYFRDMATCWSHVVSLLYDPMAQRLGLPVDELPALP